MKYAQPDLIDELAAQYVLGTLRGPARKHFERLLLSDAAVLQAVHRWEDRLADLNTEVTPVLPPVLLWERVRLLIRRERKSGFGSWNASRMALAAGVAALAIGLAWWNLQGPGSAHLVATVADQQHAQIWRIEASSNRTKLRVVAAAGFAFDTQHAYELWALPGEGAAPVSLGLMPQQGRDTLQLNETQRLALARSKQVAVSLEPLGGSTTGAPTGPVLFVADIVTAG